MTRPPDMTKADQLRAYFKRLLNPEPVKMTVQDLLRLARWQRSGKAPTQEWLPSTDPKVAICEEQTHLLPPLPENMPEWVHAAIHGTPRDGATPPVATPQQTDPIRLRDKNTKETVQVEVPWVASPRGPERGRPARPTAARLQPVAPALIPALNYCEWASASVSERVTHALTQFHKDYPGWDIGRICMNTINCMCLQISLKQDAPYVGIELKEDAELKDYQILIIGSAPKASR